MRYIIFFGYLFMVHIQADTIYITDKQNNQIQIEDPIVYYTSKKSSSLNIFYQADREKKGIRVKQGLGVVVIPWVKIDLLHLDSINHDSISARLEHNQTLMPLELISPADGLEGKSTLGTFLINFKDIKQLSTSKSIYDKSDGVPKKFQIQWGEGLNLKLTKEGLKTTINGLKVFGSFTLKDEGFRSADRVKNLRFPLHPILLVEYDHTIYILDGNKEEMIGQFKIPSMGSPRFIKIEPYENGYTSLKVMFRMLPTPTEAENKKKYVGRPGPLITTIMVYQDGKYIPLKRKGN